MNGGWPRLSSQTGLLRRHTLCPQVNLGPLPTDTGPELEWVRAFGMSFRDREKQIVEGEETHNHPFPLFIASFIADLSPCT